MAKNDFVPRTDADFVVWHDRLKNNATANAAALDIKPAELTLLGTDNTALHAKVDASKAADATSQKATKEKATARATAEKNARNLAKRVKTAAGYTPALGELLGIEGPEDSTDLTASAPTCTGTALPHGVVQVDFTKSKSDGVNLYSRRDGEADFTFLARDTASPYIDNRPLLVAGKAETRRYKAIYVLNDQEIGRASAEVAVTCVV